MATPEHKLTGSAEKDAETCVEKRAEAPLNRGADGGVNPPLQDAERTASRTESGQAEVGAGTGYKIRIPMYEGPLDLLLDLIRQQKMSIHDIRISEITAQYLDYLHKLEELDVDVSAEFI